MVEELHKDSISDRLRSKGVEEAFRTAQQVEDRDVFDVNGLRMGRVTRCFADEEGRLERCEVTLNPNAQGTLRAPANTTVVRPEWIADLASDGIHLSRAGEQVVRDGTPAGAERDRGAPDLPRKER